MARSKEITKNGEFLKYSAKKKHVVIPSGIKTIGRSAFSGELITSVTFPGTVKKIDKGAFFRCRNLKTVKIPDSVTEIGECAFANCYNLESVILPAGIHSRHGDVYRRPGVFPMQVASQSNSPLECGSYRQACFRRVLLLQVC